MANNVNKGPQDDMLEVLLSVKKDGEKNKKVELDTQKKTVEFQRELLKKVNAIYTPVSKSQSLLTDFNKMQTNFNRTLQSEISKNSELLKQNIANTKSLFSVIEKSLEQNKKPAPTVGTNKKDTTKVPNTFENKDKHEKSILGSDDTITPVLSSIKKDTSEIVKLLKAQVEQEKKQPKINNDSGSWFDKMPPAAKFLPWVLPLIAAATAVKNPEIGNGVKAGLGVGAAAARVASPLLAGAKTGASTASGLAKLGAAAAGARSAATLGNLKDSMKGPAPVGALGKLGAGAGAGATIGRAMEGDTAGATAQGISTLLPLLLAKTKYGKLAGLASAGIDVGLLGRDYIKFQDKKEQAALNGQELKSPLQNFKDDISTLGSYIGLGSKPEESLDPVVTNTAETNKILEEIRDNKSFTSGISAGGVAATGVGLGAAALMMRGGIGAKLGSGVATTGLGQRVLGAAQNAKGAIVDGASNSKAALGAGAKVAGKSAAKLIPGVGFVMGGYGAYDKLKQGDTTGAIIEGASGIASLIPGIGTAVAIGLQGISATRDAIKATNNETTSTIKNASAEVNDSLEQSNKKNNDMLKNSNATLSSTILSNSELTNKNVANSAKTANDSLTKSADTLTNTGTTLASTLTSASNSLLGMIAKFSLPGLAVQGAQKVGQWIGGAPEANPLAKGSELHSTRKNNMISVYDSLIKAGMSEKQAKAMTAEIGRENDYGNNLWGVHKDDKNGLTNVGMLSWQGKRGEALMEHLRKKGVVNQDGSIQRNKAALDAQAEFIMKELKSKEYAKAGREFLGNKDIDYKDASKVLGQDYIKWAYNNPNYAGGHTRRDNHYANLNSEIHKRGITSPEEKKQKNKVYISKAEMAKLSKAEAAPPMMASAKTHADWKKREDERKKQLSIVQKGIISGTHAVGVAPKEDKSTTKVPYAASQKDSETGGKTTPSNANYMQLGIQNVTLQTGVDMSGLQKSAREAFFTMVGDYFANHAPKNKVIVTSAFRSRAQQEILWEKYNKDPKRVAKPGTSKHEQGTAIDIDNKATGHAAKLDQLGLLSKYNFSRPLSHEPWHLEYGSGKTSSVAAAAGALADAAEPVFQDVKTAMADAGSFAAQGLSTILNSDAMESVREFMKGKIDAPKDSNPRPTAAGNFTKDESDPAAVMPADSGNGDFWDNLDQQLGAGVLQRQERNADYAKVKKAMTGGDGIFRQIGGKHGWLGEVFGNLFGEDNLLGEVFGILTGQKDIVGLPKILSKAIKGKNKQLDDMGVMGGGFGGGLGENNPDSIPVIAEHGDGTSIITKKSSEPQSNSKPAYYEDHGEVVETVPHLDGSKTEYFADGSYVYTRKDGRKSFVDSTNVVRKIVSPDGQIFQAENEASTTETTVSEAPTTTGEISHAAEETPPTGEISKAQDDSKPAYYEEGGEVVRTVPHLDGSKTEYFADDSYVYTRDDGRKSFANSNDRVWKIVYPEDHVPAASSSKSSADSTEAKSGLQAINSDKQISAKDATGEVSKAETESKTTIPNPEANTGVQAITPATSSGFMPLPSRTLSYDDSITRYEDQQFEQAKQQQQEREAEKMNVHVSVPPPSETPVQQAPQGGKSSQKGLGGQIFTRNPDSIIQQVALAYLRSSL